MTVSPIYCSSEDNWIQWISDKRRQRGWLALEGGRCWYRPPRCSSWGWPAPPLGSCLATIINEAAAFRIGSNRTCPVLMWVFTLPSTIRHSQYLVLWCKKAATKGCFLVASILILTSLCCSGRPHCSLFTVQREESPRQNLGVCEGGILKLFGRRSR